MKLLARLTVYFGWDCLLSNPNYYKEYWKLKNNESKRID